MIPVHQRRLHDTDNGVYGDCMAAAVASLLHLRLEDMPELAAPGVIQGLELERFLRARGLTLLWLRPPIMVDLRGVYHLLAGPGPRGVRHVVVACDGDMVHDPHPSGEGLVEAEDYGLFVAMEPWAPLSLTSALAAAGLSHRAVAPSLRTPAGAREVLDASGTVLWTAAAPDCWAFLHEYVKAHTPGLCEGRWCSRPCMVCGLGCCRHGGPLHLSHSEEA
jgi:hypothetical protein